MPGKMKGMTTSKDVFFTVTDFLKVKLGTGAEIENHGPEVDSISRTGKHVYTYNKNECFFICSLSTQKLYLNVLNKSYTNRFLET